MGLRFRGSYLVQQAGDTLGLAALVGTPLAGKLPPNFFDQTAAAPEDRAHRRSPASEPACKTDVSATEGFGCADWANAAKAAFNWA
jgi:hypothetical protein